MSLQHYKFRPYEVIKENYSESFIPGARSGKQNNIEHVKMENKNFTFFNY